MQPLEPTVYALLGIVLLFIPIMGIFAAATPYLMPKRECFAVTIPDVASSDPDIKHLKRSYFIAVFVATIAFTILCGACILVNPEHAFLPALVVSALVLCIGSYGLMLFFRQKTLALKQARAQSMLLVGLGTMISFIGPIIALSFMGVIAMLQALVPILIMLVIVLVAVIAVTMVYGQNGARLLRRMEEPSSMPIDDDRYWKLGVFYWNRDDASLFVPERFGVGWIMNLGRPAAWVIIIGFAVAIVGFIVFSLCM